VGLITNHAHVIKMELFSIWRTTAIDYSAN